MQLVRRAAAGVIETGSDLRARLRAQGRLKGSLIGVGVWALATWCSTATVGLGSVVVFRAQSCAEIGEMFPQLYDHDSGIGWDLWFNTPWTFTTAVVCITLSMRWSHYIGLGFVKVVAYCSLPAQAWWWHGLLVLNECS